MDHKFERSNPHDMKETPVCVNCNFFLLDVLDYKNGEVVLVPCEELVERN